MTIRKPLASTLVACSVLFFASTEIFAVGITRPNSYSTLTGLGGKVNIGEGQFINPSTTVGYHVDALAGSPDIYAFLVSYNAVNATPNTPTGWNATRFLPSDWNSGTNINIFGADNTNVSVSTTSLGSFQSLFGNDARVLLYFRSGATGVPISNGSATDVNQTSWITTTPIFTRSASADTQFLALGGNGQIIDGSLFVATPEPTSLALGVMSVAGLATFRRWRTGRKSD